MTTVPIKITKTYHQTGSRINAIEYNCEEHDPDLGLMRYQLHVKRDEYERMRAKTRFNALSFDDFVKVIRPFILGTHSGTNEIYEAFRALDTDNSGTVDIGELSALLPCIIPNASPYILLHQVQKVDKNNDCKLNLQEFTDLMNLGIGRSILTNRI